MNEDDAKKVQEAFDRLQEKLDTMSRARVEQEAAERQRRAALTPEQRAAEDRRKIFQKYAAMGAAVLARESWNLEQFAWLLIAEHPIEHTAWTSKAKRTIRAVLESCIGVTLTAIDPTARPEDQRFRVADLVEVALAKRLGYAALLQAILQNPKLPYRTALSPRAALPEHSSERSATPRALTDQRSCEHSAPLPALPRRSPGAPMSARQHNA